MPKVRPLRITGKEVALRTCSIGDVKKWLTSSTVLRPSTLINRGTVLRTGTRRTKSKLLAFSNRELRPLEISSREFSLWRLAAKRCHKESVVNSVCGDWQQIGGAIRNQ